ncbi:hypothetical protein [uncultured Akkermansia sp.]|uniref:hypothetical protein n=1 Tax=uncultured Akkermansia sp. TaxID=512294 RepID=UPI002604383E|nr:hypothetical protein [uncultured Akkermansia sp.]
MIIYIDANTLALTTAGQVPLTDMALVRGDKMPLRIVLTDGPGNPSNSDEVPVLAVKKSLGDDSLVLAATGLEHVEDALGTAYVGSLSVNTVQLAEVMGDQPRIDLIGEVVLVAPDGAQRTSRLIRVTVRADLLPGDYAPPDEVLADWSELVADALAAQLPDALKDAGVELEAVTGQSTLSSGDAADTWTIVGGYAMTWGDEILAGHLPDSCRLTSISTVYFFTDPALNQYCLRIWKLVNGAYSLIGTSAYVSNLTSGQTATWVFTPGVPLTRGDVIIIQVCEGTEMTPYALGMHAVLTPSVPGRGLVAEVANPPAVNGTMAPLMTVVVDYDDGITLGGMELATARQLDSLGRDVRQSSATAEAAARTAGQSAATASTDADNAATSATSAANSATAAQQALAAIPQVDDAGNMTLDGNITAAGGTFDGTVNANGGINIPLAVGAPTDTGAVNRLHAAGLAGVTDIFSQHAYLNTGSITATGTAATTALIPGQYAQVRVPAGTHSTIVFPFTGPNGQHNYSNFAGFSIPWRIPGAGKITIGIGRGSKTTRSDLTQGSYSIIPGNNLAHNSGEILDITFDNVRDATRGGYVVKVREIYALSEAAGWRVKTTTSFVPTTHNEPIPSIVNKIIYHQRSQYKFESEYISYGSLYLLTGGGQTVQLHKIAAVRGVNAFETGLGISSIVTDLPGNASGDVYMHVGSAVRTLYQPGNINPVYYALEALARNDIEAEETADFVDINIPL